MFFPNKPESVEELGLSHQWLEGLVIKFLSENPGCGGRFLANNLCLSTRIVESLLSKMKSTKLVVRSSVTRTGDFNYTLSEEGVARAQEAKQDSLYVGPAPVPLEQYLEGIEAQSISVGEPPTEEDVKRAFSDLLVPNSLVEAIGPAVASGKGMFLYGKPGNGKTSLAERMALIFGAEIFIPHALIIDSYIIKLFDPLVHKTVEEPGGLDQRWVAIQRPVVVVGGELTLDALEIKYNEVAGICEAPFQVKANCGVLVIDDFGRQRIEPQALLNRWIVPLEKGIDYITMPNGRKVCLPFDPMVVFSTNLNPKQLVDEAFLRRIPYKIQVGDPTETIFYELLVRMSHLLDLEPNEDVFNHLVDVHYHQTGRPFRYCHARDLLRLVKDQARFFDEPAELSAEKVDRAAEVYFIPVKSVY